MTSPDHAPRVVANTPAEEVLAQFSPDGRWVAYQTNESGRFEVVVQPFPDVGGKWPVSTAGGVTPRWRADGKELYFLAPDATAGHRRGHVVRGAARRWRSFRHASWAAGP